MQVFFILLGESRKSWMDPPYTKCSSDPPGDWYKPAIVVKKISWKRDFNLGPEKQNEIKKIVKSVAKVIFTMPCQLSIQL